MRFHATHIPYAACPFFGAGHLLSRLAAGDLPSLPLPERAGPPAGGRVRYVIAGQQPGLLTGSLYTVLKAAGAIALARDLSAAGAPPVEALFWVASEDHDLLEVNRVTLGGKKLVCTPDSAPRRGTAPPVGAIGLLHERARILAFVEEALPATEFTPWFLQMLAGVRFDTYATQFTDLLNGLFAPWRLRTVCPEDIRPQTAPVLARLVARWPDVEDAFRAGTARVAAAGVTPPLAAPAFFELVEGARVRVECAQGRAALSDGPSTYGEAAARILAEPSRFSPGAALRPVLQDAVFPGAVTLAGPTELAYLWQLRELYAVAGVTPSSLLPRMSATFVDAPTEKRLKQAGVSLGAIFDPGAAGGASEAGEAAADRVAAAAAALQETIAREVTPANQTWLARSGRALAAQTDRIVARLRCEAGAQQGIAAARLEKIRGVVLPRGGAQERAVNVCEFLARHGPHWVRALVEACDPWVLAHQVVTYEHES